MKKGTFHGLYLTWEDANGNSFTNYYSELSISAAMSQFLNLQSYGLKVKLESR